MPQTQATTETKRLKANEEEETIVNTVTIIEALKKTLADEYFLQLKTQYCHWNVEGPLFFSLHKLFETHYKEISEMVDRCAEAIRSLKAKTPASFKDFKELASIQEIVGEKFNTNQMIETLTQDHSNMAFALKSRLEDAEEIEEASAIVLYEDLITFHEKAAWMIRSHRS
ncbi:MAG: Dps family protein [Pseudobdellovibrionaceae bacterium]